MASGEHGRQQHDERADREHVASTTPAGTFCMIAEPTKRPTIIPPQSRVR